MLFIEVPNWSNVGCSWSWGVQRVKDEKLIWRHVRMPFTRGWFCRVDQSILNQSMPETPPQSLCGQQGALEVFACIGMMLVGSTQEWAKSSSWAGSGAPTDCIWPVGRQLRTHWIWPVGRWQLWLQPLHRGGWAGPLPPGTDPVSCEPRQAPWSPRRTCWPHPHSADAGACLGLLQGLSGRGKERRDGEERRREREVWPSRRPKLSKWLPAKVTGLTVLWITLPFAFFAAKSSHYPELRPHTFGFLIKEGAEAWLPSWYLVYSLTTKTLSP